MASSRLFAVFDVRERGEYNECQIPGATSLPRSQIEFRIGLLVTNLNVPIVVYDDGEGRAAFAAEALSQFGYAAVSVLNGGLTAWRNEGRQTISGVNVPSKAFGEKVHCEQKIPDISAEELHQLLEERQDVRILDVRTPEEFSRFCIPGGVNVPGGDLVLWAEELKQTNSPVIINCAGRTRSIIGTAALRRLGLTNVRALKNGTMGWVLAGFELERNPVRTASPAPRRSSAQGLSLAARVAGDEHIPSISAQSLAEALAKSDDGVKYLIDVRSEPEYESGHVAGSINVPGGQAVQRADDFIAVRNALIVFISNAAARAVMAAYWYRQMGFPNVFVLDGGLRAWREGGESLVRGISEDEPLGFSAAQRTARLVGARDLERELPDSGALILDVGTSLEFETAHLPGAKWISRGWTEIEIPRRYPDRNQAITVTCPDGRQSIFAAHALARVGYFNVSVLQGGVRAWTAEGFSIERGLDACLVQPKDIVLSPSIRGSKEDMQRYLDWELALPR